MVKCSSFSLPVGEFTFDKRAANGEGLTFHANDTTSAVNCEQIAAVHK